MFSSVRDERRGDGERHAAQVALVRFLPGVSSLVIGQRAGLSKRLTTDVTDVRFLPAVQSVQSTHTHTKTKSGMLFETMHVSNTTPYVKHTRKSSHTLKASVIEFLMQLPTSVKMLIFSYSYSLILGSLI